MVDYMKSQKERNLIGENSLIKMAEEAQLEKRDLPDDLSEAHDHYLSGKAEDVNDYPKI